MTWPRFEPGSGGWTRTPLSLPLVTPLGVLGVAKGYAHAEHAFDDRAVELGERFIVPAVSVQNATVLAPALKLAGQLERTLSTLAVIAQALGAG